MDSLTTPVILHFKYQLVLMVMFVIMFMIVLVVVLVVMLVLVSVFLIFAVVMITGCMLLCSWLEILYRETFFVQCLHKLLLGHL